MYLNIKKIPCVVTILKSCKNGFLDKGSSKVFWVICCSFSDSFISIFFSISSTPPGFSSFSFHWTSSSICVHLSSLLLGIRPRYDLFSFSDDFYAHLVPFSQHGSVRDSFFPTFSLLKKSVYILSTLLSVFIILFTYVHCLIFVCMVVVLKIQIW